MGLRGLIAALLAALFAWPAAAADAPQEIPVPNGDFEAAAAQGVPGWTVFPAAGRYRVEVSGDGHGGRSSARLLFTGDAANDEEFAALNASVEGEPYRGKRVRLTGWVRTTAAAPAFAGLWLRVDRLSGTGFFDNMADRPIRSTEWRSYSVEGDVAPDANRLAFGLLLVGGGSAWVDDLKIEVLGPATGPAPVSLGPHPRPRTAPGPGDVAPAALSELGLGNITAFARLYGYVRYFHPSDQAAATDWNAFAMAGVEAVESAADSADLARRLNALFGPIAPAVRISAVKPPHPSPPPAGASRVRWRHAGLGNDLQTRYVSAREPATGPVAEPLVVELGQNVWARIPLELPRDAAGATLPVIPAPTPAHAAKPEGFVPAGIDRTTRLADIVLLWAAMRHFYPYWDAVGGDWDAELGTTLKRAATDANDVVFRDTLRLMVAALRDGHGDVTYEPYPSGDLPLAWDWIEGRVVVTAVDAPGADLKPGDVIASLDGQPMDELIAEGFRLNSGSDQIRQRNGVQRLLFGQPGRNVSLGVERVGAGPRAVSLTFTDRSPVRETRPVNFTEPRPGVLYVDITRASDEEMTANAARMAAAKALVFDLRGYPRGSISYLPHLTDTPIKSPSFDIPIITAPDWRGVTYESFPWQIAPEAPRWTSNVVFLTDESAVSYSESVLGTVSINGLGEIVGRPTAGANGNVNYVGLPGGYLIRFTGMRVVNPDGSLQHLRGVQPTVRAERTIAGVRAGRDEVLERGLALAESRLGD